MTPSPDEQRAALELIDAAIAQDAAHDAELVHVLLCFDPMVGTWTARGPYPDGAQAMLAIETWKSELAYVVEPGEPDLKWAIAPLFTAAGDETKHANS